VTRLGVGVGRMEKTGRTLQILIVAALVTADRELCGIISRIDGLGLFQSPRTIANMITPEILFEIIETDRGKERRSLDAIGVDDI
jgi:hypothetical protein